jgi:hypothetical protein
MIKISKYYACIILFLVIFSDLRAQIPFVLKNNFDSSFIPPSPNYSKTKYWAALPNQKDMADLLPNKSNLKDEQDQAKADVFFIHPTIFTYSPKDNFQWNASVEDEVLNKTVDESTIKNQATIFNGSCKVYAPRYRQAHYSAFTTKIPSNGKNALDVAYQDVKDAFVYYLKNYNNGRPIVIAAHSQGTVHAKRLLKEFFDGKPLQKQLVEAYLVGIATKSNEFEHIKPSEDADHVGGFVTWNTYLKGYYPDYYSNGLNQAICTNPINWTVKKDFASKKQNLGGVGLKFELISELSDAQVNEGMLWINKPYVKGRIFLKTKIWHRADYNLFWLNVRDNVSNRVNNFVNANTH